MRIQPRRAIDSPKYPAATLGFVRRRQYATAATSTGSRISPVSSKATAFRRWIIGGTARRWKGSGTMELTIRQTVSESLVLGGSNSRKVIAIFPRKKPKRLIYDKACGSNALQKRQVRRDVDLVCPQKKNRVKPPLQYGCKLRGYKRRWHLETYIS
jgi:hypothetical protein